MPHILVELEPLDPTTGERVTLRAASADLREITGLGDQAWWPAISEMPTRSMTLFDGDFSTAVAVGTASLSLQIDRLAKQYANARRLFWPSAKVTIYRGEATDAWPWPVWFKGKVDRYDSKANKLRPTASIDTTALEADLLNRTYAGTSGAEGGEDLKGQVKPLIFGRARNVEPVLIDEVNSVFQFSGYGPIQAVNALFERASSYGAPTADYPSYAALVAGAIPPGRWATCLAQGMVRLGAPPAGVITGDVDGHKVGGGWPRRTGAIISAAAAIAGVDSAFIDSASLAALDAAVPRNVNVVLTDQTSLLEFAQRLARPCNAQAGVDWTGRLFACRISLDAPVVTLDAQARQMPMVIENSEADVSPPYSRIAFGADRCWRVHSLDEIASPYTLILVGPYDAERIYRQGNIADVVEGDGSTTRWEYINATPAAGIFPTEGAYWTLLDDRLTGVLIAYPDGTPVAALQPAEPDATRGAPEGTYVADRLAEQVIADAVATMARVEEASEHLSQLLTDYLKTMLLGETREGRAQGLAWMDGEHLHTVQRRETAERIEGDEAIVTTISLIGAKSLDGASFILDVDAVKVSPTQSYAERDAEISASLTTLGGTITANYTALQTAIADEAAARVTAISTLTSALATETSNREAAIVTVQEAITDEAGSRATAIADLQSQVDGVEADLAAQVSTLSEAISDESSARASALTTVNATLTSHDATLSANTASIGTLSTSLATLTTTEADHYASLSASISGVSATVTTHSSAISSLQGRTGAYWSVTTNTSSGATAFISARAETSPGVVTSNVAFGAKEVHISNPSAGSGWTMVLRVAGGNVEIYGNLKTTGSVSTPNLISNSVTKVESTLSGSTRTSNGSWYNVLSGAWHTFTLDYAADVLVLFMGRANYIGSSSLIVRMILYNAAEAVIGSVEGPSSGDGAYMSNPSFPATWSLSAGTYHIGPQFLADSGDVEMRSGSGVIVFIRYK